MSGDSGSLIGVGVGPGDPELLTVKAVRALERADVVAYFAKRGRRSHAREAAAPYLRVGCVERALLYPLTTEVPRHAPEYRVRIQDFYSECVKGLGELLDSGLTVAVLSEGDPLLYGSYMHLHVRLAPRYATHVIPGVTSLSGCWSAAGTPMAQGDDVLSVLPATLSEAELTRRLAQADPAAIIKLGRNLGKLRRALRATQREDEAIYVERGTLPGALQLPLVEKLDDWAPYFALVLLPGWRGRV